ncbi:MAG TPA: M43 family zinc metalloprotease [Chryseosolibacter sp.]|nr:M43 family zinc metalloprotease [Chryseosolibacter sp.]
MNRIHYFISVALIATLSVDVFGQGMCLSDRFLAKRKPSSSAVTESSAGTMSTCTQYTVRVYVHRLRHSAGYGYGSFIDQTLLDRLNASYNQYGIFFTLSGSRDWNNNFFSDPNTPSFALAGIFDDPGANQQSNAINIYVLPSNSQIQGGFVPDNNKKVMVLGGTRAVTHCSGGTTNYEIAQHRIVSHEMGHCFGLVHTFQYDGDDGLSDTPIDHVRRNECVNPSNCQFVPNCATCNVASNPTTTMNNFMSYTVPTCMSFFSPMQLDVMKNAMNNNMSSVVTVTQLSPPNMQLMTYDNNKPVSTVTFVSAGYHTIYTNLNPSSLTQNVQWSANAAISPFGSKLVNASFNIYSGQSINFSITATNACGSANRNPTFVAQSGYYMYPNPAVGKSFSLKFDYSGYHEALPTRVAIYDLRTNDLEMTIDVVAAKEAGLIDGNTLEIDVEKLKRGLKVVRIYYGKEYRSVRVERLLLR